jgi:hypothetical protein
VQVCRTFRVCRASGNGAACTHAHAGTLAHTQLGAGRQHIVKRIAGTAGSSRRLEQRLRFTFTCGSGWRGAPTLGGASSKATPSASSGSRPCAVAARPTAAASRARWASSPPPPSPPSLPLWQPSRAARRLRAALQARSSA